VFVDGQKVTYDLQAVRRRIERFHGPGDRHELTFSCHRCLPFPAAGVGLREGPRITRIARRGRSPTSQCIRGIGAIRGLLRSARRIPGSRIPCGGSPARPRQLRVHLAVEGATRRQGPAMRDRPVGVPPCVDYEYEYEHGVLPLPEMLQHAALAPHRQPRVANHSGVPHRSVMDRIQCLKRRTIRRMHGPP
jgi:hypothetical protein